ncbi:MAG: GNAT family N-acetyltransferase [Planctomycetes bacterium]|nr:GNAT family N-acetyltransferase [Planctomycetota bacterium]MCH9726734.1 GNAT family N-acetyltransferase [Planctomycetota bacterium]MCH9779642.1 GNAT family N-acetyltransferase [Planctomycetota bacterium]
MQFREIQREDIPALFAVRIATWDNPRGEAELNALGITVDSVSQMLEESHRGWLCEIENRVVGFVLGNKETGEMWVIAVLKEHEGKGIGKQLLTRIEEWLWSEGWKEIWLTTDLDESHRAVGFYRHLGWEDWKLENDRFMKKTRPTHE